MNPFNRDCSVIGKNELEMIGIEGRKLQLRDIRMNDLDVYRRWNQPGQHWQEFDGPYYPVMTADEVEVNIKKLKLQRNLVTRKRLASAKPV